MKIVKRQEGFTLVEMLIVLLIISMLILITIPNVGKHFQTIDDKGCDAFINMVQGQVEAYRVDELKYPTVTDLVTKGYLKNEEAVCPNGQKYEILADGQVVLKQENDDDGGS